MLAEIKGIVHSKYNLTDLPLILMSMEALVAFSVPYKHSWVPQSERISPNRSVLYSSVKEKIDDKKHVFILLMWCHLSVQNTRFCLETATLTSRFWSKCSL